MWPSPSHSPTRAVWVLLSIVNSTARLSTGLVRRIIENPVHRLNMFQVPSPASPLDVL